MATKTERIKASSHNTLDKAQSSTRNGWDKTSASTRAGWEKTKENSKAWFDKTGDPTLSKGLHKVGAETFWPTSLDREADKAARILRSFCIDGFAAQDMKNDGDAAESEKKEVDARNMQLYRIPQDVLRDCQGIAIFTVIRTGFLSSRSGGSGIIVRKLPDGSWSPPSGIVITALGIGFQAGADIYDCVCVINNEEGLESFTNRGRFTLGGEVGAAAGPLGGGVHVGSEVHKRQAPVLTYTKGRGLYAGVQVRGTAIVERTSENERFYSAEGVRNEQVLAGEVDAPEGTMDRLWETLKAVQGREHDANKLPPPRHAPDDEYGELEPPKEGSQKEYEELGLCPEERERV